MITEDYCSYEVSKLLKDKGFNDPFTHMFINKDNVKFDCSSTGVVPKETIACPTHQMAMKWLREVYDLHIIAYPFKSGNDVNATHYCCQVFKTFNLLGCEKYTNETLTSYEQAVETALKYCLEKLI